ncbi:MAG: flagellar biosynthetic protein FliO [Lachnospiraceae bacterium]|nr:flagellar biosynthetic protein FliO [Lachnospiraceae bacterium]
MVATAQNSIRSLFELLGLIIIFVIVLVVCYYTTKFVAGRQLVQKKMGNFEVFETYAIAQNKYLQLVRMGNKYVVISVTKDSVTYITELAEEEVCQIQKSTSGSGKSFKEVLSGLYKKSEEQ